MLRIGKLSLVTCWYVIISHVLCDGKSRWARIYAYIYMCFARAYYVHTYYGIKMLLSSWSWLTPSSAPWGSFFLLQANHPVIDTLCTRQFRSVSMNTVELIRPTTTLQYELVCQATPYPLFSWAYASCFSSVLIQQNGTVEPRHSEIWTHYSHTIVDTSLCPNAITPEIRTPL